MGSGNLYILMKLPSNFKLFNNFKIILSFRKKYLFTGENIHLVR